MHKSVIKVIQMLNVMVKSFVEFNYSNNQVSHATPAMVLHY